MRRVRKEDIQRDAWAKPDGMSVCLECWQKWMLTDDRDLSASRMKLDASPEDQERVAYESDPYADQRKADMKAGEAVNAMIDSLKPAWRWAIYRKYSISTAWNFPRLDWLSALSQALEELEKKLRRNIATAIYFE